jgi:hypothetical protein
VRAIERRERGAGGAACELDAAEIAKKLDRIRHDRECRDQRRVRSVGAAEPQLGDRAKPKRLGVMRRLVQQRRRCRFRLGAASGGEKLRDRFEGTLAGRVGHPVTLADAGRARQMACLSTFISAQ